MTESTSRRRLPRTMAVSIRGTVGSFMHAITASTVAVTAPIAARAVSTLLAGDQQVSGGRTTIRLGLPSHFMVTR
jgi:hypothetical protein